MNIGKNLVENTGDFEVSKLVDAIITRLDTLGEYTANDKMNIRISLFMANDGKGHKVDLAKLLTFSDCDFLHDVHGLNAHTDRKPPHTILDCFEPRCGFAA